jgi:valyl-tRNA synthetase
MLAVVAGQLEARVVLVDHRGAALSDADRRAERARIEKELAQAEAALAATRVRLADPAFVERAPATVVEAARTRERELAERVVRLHESLA